MALLLSGFLMLLLSLLQTCLLLVIFGIVLLIVIIVLAAWYGGLLKVDVKIWKDVPIQLLFFSYLFIIISFYFSLYKLIITKCIFFKCVILFLHELNSVWQILYDWIWMAFGWTHILQFVNSIFWFYGMVLANCHRLCVNYPHTADVCCDYKQIILVCEIIENLSKDDFV